MPPEPNILVRPSNGTESTARRAAIIPAALGVV
jgi:hypothetical protein